MSAIFWGAGSSVSWGKELLRLPIAARSFEVFKKKSVWWTKTAFMGTPLGDGDSPVKDAKNLTEAV